MGKDEKKLSSYRRKNVDQYIDSMIHQFEHQQAELRSKNKMLEKENEALKEEVAELHAKEELIFKAIYDATHKIKSLEEETTNRCQEMETRIESMRADLLATAEGYKDSAKADACDAYEALASYIDELEHMNSTVIGIQENFGVRKASFDLDSVNQAPGLEEICKELGLMPDEAEAEETPCEEEDNPQEITQENPETEGDEVTEEQSDETSTDEVETSANPEE